HPAAVAIAPVAPLLYSPSLHDALPISDPAASDTAQVPQDPPRQEFGEPNPRASRESSRVPSCGCQTKLVPVSSRVTSAAEHPAMISLIPVFGEAKVSWWTAGTPASALAASTAAVKSLGPQTMTLSQPATQSTSSR